MGAGSADLAVSCVLRRLRQAKHGTGETGRRDANATSPFPDAECPTAMGRLGTPHIHRLAYVCDCRKGKGPHIHWDLFRQEPESLDHLEETPTGEYMVVTPKKDETEK